jgi:cell wall-associated NlpC family hydrolase
MSHWADKYIGVPFVDGGNGPDGFDCWGLSRYVLAQEFGVQLPAYNYALEDTPVEERLADRLRVVTENEAQYRALPGPVEGALVLFHTRGRRPHIGVCTDQRNLLHMTKELGAVVVPLNSSLVRNGLVGYYLPDPR